MQRCLSAVLLFLCTLVTPWLHAADNESTTTGENAAVVNDEQKRKSAAVIRIEEMIDEWQATYVSRAVEDAIAQNVDYIITIIDTNGGRVDSAMSIFNTFLKIDGPDQPRLVAFIPEKAFSAGALIAFSHHEIHLTPRASIGDIGVIFQNAEGGIEYAPEKMVSPIRADLRKASALRGWDPAWLQKMTDRNQNLYKIRHNPEKEVYVIEENLSQYLADHPDIDKENESQVIKVLGEDRLVTQHGEEAVALNIASAVSNNLSEVYNSIGITETATVDLSPTGTESTARWLGSFAPILLGLTVMFIIFEVKTAGVGLFAGLACITGFLFFICNYYQSLVSYSEIILIFLGLLLIAIEIFTMIGGGFLAIIGACIAFAGIFMSFMPESGQFDFENPFYGDYITSAALNSVLTFFVMAIAFAIFLYAAPKIPALRKLAVVAEIEGSSEGATSVEEENLIGQTGVAQTQLRPSGQVLAKNGKSYSATVKNGSFIDANQNVLIKEHRYGELIVELAEGESA